MGKTEFTVHKHVVQNNRMGMRLWAYQNHKSEVYESLEPTWCNLETFKGDRVPLKIVTNEYIKFSCIANEPNLGLKVVQVSNFKKSPFYNVLIRALRPILSIGIEIPPILVLRMASRFFGIMTEIVTIRCQELNDTIVIEFKPNLPDQVSYHQIEGAMFGFSRLISNLIQQWPNLVQFTHAPTIIHHQVYVDFFHSTSLFKQANNQLNYHFPKTALGFDYPLLINPIINALRKQFQHMSFAEIMSILLEVTLGYISPTRQNIADALSISIRTLQRRLTDEGHTFNALLLQVRKKLVVEYLGDQYMSSEQISSLLGYRAKSQFLKAFRQWFGMSPKEYRAKMNFAL